MGRDSYLIPSRPETGASDVRIIGIIPVCFRYASVLFDPGSTFSYASTYFSLSFDFTSKPLAMPIHVYTPIGDFSSGFSAPSFYCVFC